MVLYPVCVYPQKDGSFEIHLPDLGFTVKGEDMLVAMSSAVETLTAIIHYRTSMKREIPDPSHIADIVLNRKSKGSFKTLVHVADN